MDGQNLAIDNVALAGAPRPAAYSSVSFTAFRIETPFSRGAVSGSTREIDIGDPATLKDAIAAAQAGCLHKEHLAIREHDELNERVRIHLFAIRRRAPTWVYLKDGDVYPTRVADLYADPICVMDGEMLR